MDAADVISNGAGVPLGQGSHWLLDLSNCACAPELLRDAATLRRLCVQACMDAAMKVVGDSFHQFQPVGVTGVVLLAESHLAVHTWPEIDFVALDVYVCDFSQHNAAKGEALALAMRQLFTPGAVSERCLPRVGVRPQLAATAPQVSYQASHA